MWQKGQDREANQNHLFLLVLDVNECKTGLVLLLWLYLFILSEVVSSLFSSSILGTYQPEEFIFQCPIFLPFHTVHGLLNIV